MRPASMQQAAGWKPGWKPERQAFQVGVAAPIFQHMVEECQKIPALLCYPAKRVASDRQPAVLGVEATSKEAVRKATQYFKS